MTVLKLFMKKNIPLSLIKVLLLLEWHNFCSFFRETRQNYWSRKKQKTISLEPFQYREIVQKCNQCYNLQVMGDAVILKGRIKIFFWML